MKKLLKKIERIVDNLLGNKSNELFWKFHHFFERNWPEKCVSEESFNYPHRQLLVNIISKYTPLENIFEVGCAAGPNLYLLAKKFPKTKIYGSDISKYTIDFGKNWFIKEGIKNVEFFTSNAETSLKNFKGESIDIIFSDATLIYFNEKKIEKMLKEMTRVGRKALILKEQHTEGPPIFDSHWIHNYKNLLANLISKENVKFTKIPKNIWPDKNWTKYGNIIEINLEK